MTIEDLSPPEMGAPKMRWMTAGGAGTFLELTALEADFFRADIVMDRDELMQIYLKIISMRQYLGCMLMVWTQSMDLDGHLVRVDC